MVASLSAIGALISAPTDEAESRTSQRRKRGRTVRQVPVRYHPGRCSSSVSLLHRRSPKLARLRLSHERFECQFIGMRRSTRNHAQHDANCPLIAAGSVTLLLLERRLIGAAGGEIRR